MSNIFPGELVAPVSDTTVSVVPTLSLDRTTPRQSEKLTYSPSFIFYQPTSVLDTVDQSASFGFQDRLTQQLTVNLQESFLRTSNVFDESYIYSQGGVSGSAQTQAAEVIFPFAEQWDNMVHGIADYQFGRDAMAGGGGSFTLSDFPSSTNSAGAFNSHSSGGLAFFSERPTHNQYLGFVYQYARTTEESSTVAGETQSHSFLPFYTFYFTRTFSFSVSGGPEHVAVTQTQSANTNSWSPTVIASVGWQGNRTNFAASFSRSVNSEQGLVGAYTAEGVNGFGSWKFARSWTGSVSGSYGKLSTITAASSSYAGGTTITGQASLAYTVGEHLRVEAGYDRLHEQYLSIPAISGNPNSDMVYGNVTYEFHRPLGR